MIVQPVRMGELMSTLRSILQELADRFASDVLAAVRSASLQELLAEAGGEATRRSTTKAAPSVPRAPSAPRAAGGRSIRIVGGKLARRSQADIDSTLGLVVAALKATPEGMRSEEIRDFLKLDKRELPRVLGAGLAKKALKSKGRKRATTYFAA
jgi:hypothetical protein